MTRRALVVVVALAMVLPVGMPLLAGQGTAAGGPSEAGAPTSIGKSSTASLTQENNTTVRHQNPDETNEQGDLAAVRRQLAGRMTEISIDCSEGIEVGNFDACEDLNDSYSDSLSKYVEVTGQDDEEETGQDDEEETESGESFRDLQREQREFANETRRYQQTYEEYQEARRNGNTSRARRLARELLELRGEITRTGENVTRTAGDVQNGTGLSLAAVNESTQAVMANVSNTTRTVVSEVFVRTNVTATEKRRVISGREPLVVTGRVRTANGSVIPNGSVVLATGAGPAARTSERTRVSTNDSGFYRLSYQPTAIRTGNRTLSIRYQPPATSVYLPANAPVNATVRGVTGDLAVSNSTDRVGYNGTVRVDTQVTVNDSNVAAPGVPLTLRVAGRTLARGTTDRNGTVVLRGRLPAGIEPGGQSLVVSGPGAQRAVTVSDATREVRVVSTATSLSGRVVQTAAGEPRLRVVGRLRAVEGAGVADQSVAVRIGGQEITTLRTNATGHYRGTVTIPNASYPDSGQATVGVTLVFDGAGTNLEGDRRSERLSVQGPPATDSGGPVSAVISAVTENPVLAGAGLLGLLALVLTGGFVVLQRREDSGSAGGDGSDGGSTGSGADGGMASGGGATGATSGSEVSAMQAALSAGDYARAVLSGYAAVRRGLPMDGAEAATHWEFYRRAVDGGLSDEQRTALRTVTEAFEQVSYAGATPDATEADSVLEAVRAIVGEAGEESEARGADD